ncbi:MraY family glycosyltransferase [Deinococcus sp.]|uniref:MraY family glycosyltransferase n=1 Tax=Deinococcus sp. TaxID=47478 RepID=UPI0025FFD3C1|nr:MraY family glycosyltransferase [Deinococcus sp.]
MDQLRTFAQQLGIADLFGRGFWAVLLTFITAALITWRFIPQVRAFALRVGWADAPNERRINTVPLPNAGGLAIFAGFIVSLVVGWALRPIVIETVNVQVLAILLGATLLVLVGFIDDQFELTPMFRLGVQVLAATLLLVNGLRIDVHAVPFLHGLGGPGANLLGIALTVLWVVGLTNAMNLLDGVDGVVGGVAFIASMVLLVTAAQFPDRAAAVILLAGLAGSALGYLRHNFNPSRIIMGDAGSTMFGYTLAAVSLLGTLKVSAGASLIVPLLIMALPIVDTTQVVLGRLARGIRNPLRHPDKTHLHFRVLARTGNARRTAALLWAAALICGVLGMFVQKIAPMTVILTALFIGGALWYVAARRIRAQMVEAAQGRKELN